MVFKETISMPCAFCPEPLIHAFLLIQGLDFLLDRATGILLVINGLSFLLLSRQRLHPKPIYVVITSTLLPCTA